MTAELKKLMRYVDKNNPYTILWAWSLIEVAKDKLRNPNSKMDRGSIDQDSYKWGSD